MSLIGWPARLTVRAPVFQIVDAENRILDLVAAADQGAQTSHQFLPLEGLGQVIIGAEVEALDLVLDGTARRQHQDMSADAGAAPFLQERQAVLLREHDIEDDEVVIGRPGLVIRFLAVQRGINGEPFFFEALFEGPHHGLVIFDEENAHVATPFKRVVSRSLSVVSYDRALLCLG